MGSIVPRMTQAPSLTPLTSVAPPPNHTYGQIACQRQNAARVRPEFREIRDYVASLSVFIFGRLFLGPPAIHPSFTPLFTVAECHTETYDKSYWLTAILDTVE